MQAMEAGVEDVELSGEVTLDIEALAEYSGQGMCKKVKLFSKNENYRKELWTWARSRNWGNDLNGNPLMYSIHRDKEEGGRRMVEFLPGF